MITWLVPATEMKDTSLLKLRHTGCTRIQINDISLNVHLYDDPSCFPTSDTTQIDDIRPGINPCWLYKINRNPFYRHGISYHMPSKVCEEIARLFSFLILVY